MASNHTTNYQLNQWEATDQVRRTEFNEDNAKIDAALKANAEAIETRAEKTALESLGEQLAQAQASQLRVAAGSYVGTGGSGSGQPNSLTFAFPPQIVFIAENADQRGVAGTVFLRGQSQSSGMGVSASGDQLGFQLTWSGNTLSWYTTMRNVDDAPTLQFNRSGATYRYLALG